MHSRFVKIRSELKQMLNTTTIFDLVNEMNDGLSFLKK